MELKKQSGNHCTIYATAMVIGVEPSEIIDLLGHDGTEMLQDDDGFLHPFGIHYQEIVDVATYFNWRVTMVERHPRNYYPNRGAWRIWSHEHAEKRWTDWVMHHTGVLVGLSPYGGHACAWDGEKVYDPNGKIYDLADFNPAFFLAFTRCQEKVYISLPTIETVKAHFQSNPHKEKK